MILKLIEKEEFQKMFDGSSCVLEADYGDVALSYWIHHQSKLGIKVVYRFGTGITHRQYYYCDLSEVYTGQLQAIELYTLEKGKRKTEIQRIVIAAQNDAKENKIIEAINSDDV
jgi:hypothetical protein